MALTYCKLDNIHYGSEQLSQNKNYITSVIYLNNTTTEPSFIRC